MIPRRWRNSLAKEHLAQHLVLDGDSTALHMQARQRNRHCVCVCVCARIFFFSFSSVCRHIQELCCLYFFVLLPAPLPPGNFQLVGRSIVRIIGSLTISHCAYGNLVALGMWAIYPPPHPAIAGKRIPWQEPVPTDTANAPLCGPHFVIRLQVYKRMCI